MTKQARPLYRLKQPLHDFRGSWKKFDRKHVEVHRDLILCYDVIYNLLDRPTDMDDFQIRDNATSVCEMLGKRIEDLFGEEIFETELDKQLCFDLEEK